MKTVKPLIALMFLVVLSQGLANACRQMQACLPAPTLHLFEANARSFREIRREALFSMVEVQQGSGSVAGPMFLLQGVCGLMHTRHQTSATVNESTLPNQWQVYFVNKNASVNGLPLPDPSKSTHAPSSSEQKVWTLDECQLVGY